MKSATRLLLLLMTAAFAIPKLKAQEPESHSEMTKIIKDFELGLQQYNFPNPALDFKTSINRILSAGTTNEQKTFINSLDSRLKRINEQSIPPSLLIDYLVIRFELATQQARIELFEKSKARKVSNSTSTIHQLENGAEWYAYLVRKWTGSDLSIKEIMDFGKSEVKRIKQEISRLDIDGPPPTEYITKNENLIEKRISQKHERITKVIGQFMPDFAQLPPLRFARGNSRQLVQTPAYYSGNTFYYNIFENGFNLADIDFLLIHEGNPGHHFQVAYHSQLPTRTYNNYLFHSGFTEGWAAYTENLGWELGLYTDTQEALSKWNWDLIRSMRVVLDVAINYYGWTDKMSLDYWKQHISGKDDIGAREIARMKRWPAQVLTYKLGESEILKALSKEQENKGSQFDFKLFHTQLLSRGTLPVSVITRLFQ